MTPPFVTDWTAFLAATGKAVFYLNQLNLAACASKSRGTLAATLLTRRF